MPDLDTGHIFLTTLAPIKTTHTDGTDSFEQRARIALSELPTAMQSPATENIGINSPFSRNTRNHLARMFVLSDVIYNGRTGMNPILGTIKGVNPTDPQKIDRLKELRNERGMSLMLITHNLGVVASVADRMAERGWFVSVRGQLQRA